MKLTFYIGEYVDGNLSIQTNHMHYAFRDDLNFDDFAPEKLYMLMAMIKATCKREGIEPRFVLK